MKAQDVFVKNERRFASLHSLFAEKMSSADLDNLTKSSAKNVYKFLSLVLTNKKYSKMITNYFRQNFSTILYMTLNPTKISTDVNVINLNLMALAEVLGMHPDCEG